MQKEKLNLAKNKNIIKFAKEAKRYCLFIENFTSLKEKEVIYQLVEMLTIIYGDALYLPKLKTLKKHYALDNLTKTDYDLISKSLFQKTKTMEKYWIILNPLTSKRSIQDELAMAATYDDLADIYRDLKNGLIEYEKGLKENIHRAVWHWRFNFYTHWGNHVVRLLSPLHDLLEQDFVEND